MADGRKNNGGHSTAGKAGRPSKAQELQLLETIIKSGGEGCTDSLWKKIWEQANAGSYPHQRMIAEYMYGKPKETKDLNIAGNIVVERPNFDED